MTYIKLECITGNVYEGKEVTSKQIPKTAKFVDCGQTFFGKPFNVYKTYSKKGSKTYLLFTSTK